MNCKSTHLLLVAAFGVLAGVAGHVPAQQGLPLPGGPELVVGRTHELAFDRDMMVATDESVFA